MRLEAGNDPGARTLMPGPILRLSGVAKNFQAQRVLEAWAKL